MPSSPLEAALDRLLGHHVVDGEVLADIAQKIEEADRPQPVDVVAHQRGVGRPGGEVEKPLELPANPLRVVLDLLEGQQRSLLALSARIADETGAAADERDWR